MSEGVWGLKAHRLDTRPPEHVTPLQVHSEALLARLYPQPDGLFPQAA